MLYDIIDEDAEKLTKYIEAELAFSGGRLDESGRRSMEALADAAYDAHRTIARSNARRAARKIAKLAVEKRNEAIVMPDAE